MSCVFPLDNIFDLFSEMRNIFEEAYVLLDELRISWKQFLGSWTKFPRRRSGNLGLEGSFTSISLLCWQCYSLMLARY